MSEQASQNKNEDKSTKGTSEHKKRNFWTALIVATVLFLILMVIMAIRVGKGGELVWWGTVLLWIITLIGSGIFALASKRWVTLGLLGGAVVGLVVIVFSCAVTLPTK